MLKKMGFSGIDVALFAVFAIVYAVFGVLWTLNLTPLGPASEANLLEKKELVYYGLWLCAVAYAVLANSFVLRNKSPKGGLIAFPITIAVMAVVFFALTALTNWLKDPTTIAPSTKILSISIGDLLVLLPVVSAVIVFIIAWLGAGLTNHMRGQPVTQGFIRLGVALMAFPLVQQTVLFFFPRWDDEVRGVVTVGAMSLGLLWGLFLGGAIGSNLRKPPSDPANA